MDAIEKRARELLARAYEADGMVGRAGVIRNPSQYMEKPDRRALGCIIAAISADQPDPRIQSSEWGAMPDVNEQRTPVADTKQADEYQYRSWNDDQPGRPGWSSWQPISRSDYERELVEPVEGREVRALYAVPPLPAVGLWQPIETAPKSGRSMLLGYFNSLGNWRTVRGRWFSAEQIEADWDDPDDFEAGWYEESVEADDTPNVWPITPTHWQPLPAAPSVDGQVVGK